MEETDGDFKQILNTMKVQQHRQKKQQQKLRKMFTILKISKNVKYETHYRISLYAKVFKGLMIYRILLHSFAEQLQNFYVDILLRTHFNAIKKFKEMRSIQIKQKFQALLCARKRKIIKLFIKQVHLDINKKEEIEKKIEKKQSKSYKAKTEQNFYRSINARSPIRPAGSYQCLQDSRKSTYSVFSNTTDIQSRRKFTVIKQLPQKPNLQSIRENETIYNLNESSETYINESKRQIDQNYQTEQYTDKNERQPVTTFKHGPIESESSKNMRLNKDEILSYLSQIKYFQISTISSIIDQYSQSLKSQSTLTEQSILTKSKKSLQNLLSIVSL